LAVFFLLSGENPALSYSELRHLVKILGGVDAERVDERVAAAEVDDGLAAEIVYRAAYTKLAAVWLGVGRNYMDVVFSEKLAEAVDGRRSFDVMVYEVGGVDVNSVDVEKKLAAAIMAQAPGLRVDLSTPEATFVAVVTMSNCFVGMLIAEKPKHFFDERKAGRRPFRVPSAMQPKLARCLVNLAVNSRGSWVLDPFAGSGALVIEAGLLGHVCLGVEVKTWVCNGMWRNMQSYGVGFGHAVQGDARRLPLRRFFDAVATDPPYGRSATLGGVSFKNLLKAFGEEVVNVLTDGARLAVTVPHTAYPDLVDAFTGFRELEHHDLYVHRSLTRRVVVMKLD
jgi:tRNA (guanine10-N2)-dimethyltransferase